MSKWTLPLVLASFELVFMVTAYSKVSVNNGQARSSGSVQDVAFTVSPNVYVVTPRTIELRPGEVVDHPSTPVGYSTLDEEQVAQLDAMESRQRAQDRFVPHSGIDAHTHALRQQQLQKPSSSPTSNDVVYTKPIVSMTFDYPSGPTSYEGKPGKPGNDLPLYPPLKPLDSYPSSPSNDDAPPSPIHASDASTFNFDNPPKSIEYLSHYESPFVDVPSYAGPYPHDDIIYDDHDYHHHHQHNRPKPTTTEEPEMMDQRLNNRPHYSYYYIGKKLWYVPLYFSIYFIIYIAALVLKSIARHKINLPANLAAAAEGANARSQDGLGWRDYVVGVLDAVEKYGSVFKD
ncbi:uncharacterized protein LOC131671308 [Phymastichus coffea]|uniref:uncharacterized protein LOC131671308 n=1 Tax=Phymastichus coffea TaxID=108790 RepID=UPI00273A7BC4|nr:uncharacterized protein LOC131671308 [Phymastichus coffea]